MNRVWIRSANRRHQNRKDLTAKHIAGADQLPHLITCALWIRSANHEAPGVNTAQIRGANNALMQDVLPLQRLQGPLQGDLAHNETHPPRTLP